MRSKELVFVSGATKGGTRRARLARPIKAFGAKSAARTWPTPACTLPSWSRARTLDPRASERTCTRGSRAGTSGWNRRKRLERRMVVHRGDVKRVYKEQEGWDKEEEDREPTKRGERRLDKKTGLTRRSKECTARKKREVPRRDRAVEIIRGGKKGNSRKQKQEQEGKKEKSGGTRGKFRVYTDQREHARDNVHYVHALCQRGRKRDEKRAKSGSRLNAGSICEHVTHMERPLYA